MVLISAGEFLYGSDRSDPQRNDLVESEPTKLPNQRFCVDTYEYPNRKGGVPTSGVTWLEAQSLCMKQGKRLCTQEEWERACKGPTGGKWNRRYPYGDQFVEGACNTSSAGDLPLEEGKAAPAGSFPRCVTPEGIHDMSGNVDEWTVSPGRFSRESRVTRGGSHQRPGWTARCTSLRELTDTAQETDVGLRCCKDAQ